jgi:hypothetical protein
VRGKPKSLRVRAVWGRLWAPLIKFVRNHPAVANLIAVAGLAFAVLAYCIPQDNPSSQAPGDDLSVSVLEPIRSLPVTALPDATLAYFLQSDPRRLDPPAKPFGWEDRDLTPARQWIRGQGGLDAGRTVLDLVVGGVSADAIVLLKLDIEVVQRRTPPTGYVLHFKPSTGGPVELRYLDANLDQGSPSVALVDRRLDSVDGRWNFPVTVSSQDPEYFVLSVETATCDCSWVARLHYAMRGEQRVHVIKDANGEPFRTIAAARSRHVGTVDGLKFYDCDPTTREERDSC